MLWQAVSDTGSSAIKSIPNTTGINLQHLRRVVKDDYFSQQLKDKLEEDTSTHATSFLHLVYILLAPTSHISLDALQLLLAKHVPFYSISTLSAQSPPPILTLLAPLYAPSTAAHAVEQSTTLWPTTYNPNTTYGPNPAMVAQAQEELENNGEVDVYMALARQAGMQVEKKNLGLRTGAVIVERLAGQGQVVAVAGDARWAGREQDSGKGNPAGHAVLRAIDFVAQKHRAIAAVASADVNSDKESPAIHAFPAPAVCQSPDSATTKTDHNIAANYAAQLYHAPLTSLEEDYLSLRSNPGSPSPNGYLCLNLEVYLTHEPCVMCSMALIHSRVGRVVFGGSAGNGIASGALRAEVADLGEERHKHDDETTEHTAGGSEQPPMYGLFWREDLNWRFNAWEWRADVSAMAEVGEDGGVASVLQRSRLELPDDVQI